MKIRDIEWMPGPYGSTNGFVGKIRTFALHMPTKRGETHLLLHNYLNGGVDVQVADRAEGEEAAAEWLTEFVSQFVEEG